MPLLVSGTRVNETLVVDRLLGEGAYAEVHRVRHEYLGRQAMKLFKQIATLRGVQGMLDEARLLSTLGHPNIVRVFDAGTLPTPDGYRGYFTMEYIAGGSLERWRRVHATTAVPLDVVVSIIEQIAAALAVAHRQSPPILHRDLTLENVLIGYDGSGMRARLSDFGLAKHADPLTHLASAQGTYAFMAPEVQRFEGYSSAADVWSLGVIAYLLLTNHHPYDDGRPFHRYSPQRYRMPPLPPSRFNERVDRDLDRIVAASLAADPEQRTPDAVVFAAHLRDWREAGTRRPPPALPALDVPSTSAAMQDSGRRLMRHILDLAKDPATLAEAADLLEEAVSLSPVVAERYVHLLKLWRRGVMV